MNEIQYELGQSGQTLYAVGRNNAGQAWNGSAFVTYTTTRSTFAESLPEVGSTGYYGPISIDDADWWQIYIQAGGSPSHTDDIRLATGYASLTTDEIADAVTTGSTPVNQSPVPASRTWILKPSGDGLVGELPIVRHAGESNIFSIDWRNDLATNGRVVSIDSVSIVSAKAADGTTIVGGIVISDDADDQGVDRSQTKHTINLVTPGTYVIEVAATYDHGDGIAQVTLIVT